MATWDRWSTHLETTVAVDLPTTGVTLRLSQDPNSGNLGLTVWDASIVLAAYADRNSGKGDLCRARVAGKRVIDLGSGAGVAGLALALLGADVTLTDSEYDSLFFVAPDGTTTRVRFKP